MGKDELTLLVLCRLNENLNLVTDFEVRIVTELRGGDDTFALGADVHYYFPLVNCCNDTFYDLVLDDLQKGLIVKLGIFLLVDGCCSVILESIPIEVLGSYGSVESLLFRLFCFYFLHYGSFIYHGGLLYCGSLHDAIVNFFCHNLLNESN